MADLSLALIMSGERIDYESSEWEALGDLAPFTHSEIIEVLEHKTIKVLESEQATIYLPETAHNITLTNKIITKTVFLDSLYIQFWKVKCSVKS